MNKFFNENLSEYKNDVNYIKLALTEIPCDWHGAYPWEPAEDTQKAAYEWLKAETDDDYLARLTFTAYKYGYLR